MATPPTNLVAVLLQRGLITDAQLRNAQAYARRHRMRLPDSLVALGHVTPDDLVGVIAAFCGMEPIDLRHVVVPPEVIAMMPECVARENFVLPLALRGDMLRIAVGDPTDGETIQKLRFILNRDVEAVLARPCEILDAIRRHYGELETTVVDSLLCEFTDTQIDFAQTETPVRPGLTSIDLDCPDGTAWPGPGAHEAGNTRLVERHATVRYFHRMNPLRTFPLLVVLSDRLVREVAKRAVSQAESKRFAVAEGAVVEIEPVLPGCTCYPPRECVRVGPVETCARFWVVPHVLGEVMQARVVVRQGETVLAEVPLEARVVRQTPAVVMGALSLALPPALMVLKHYHLDFESQLADGFALYAWLAHALVQALSPELLAGALLALTAAAYLWMRPRQRDVFWDITPVAPHTDTHKSAPRPADDTAAATEESISVDALRRADRCYQARDFAGALRLYEQGLGLEGLRAVHYFRASLAAAQLGDAERALTILSRATATLPPAELWPTFWYNMGCFATRLRRFAEALGFLNRAVDAGYRNAAKYRSDPDLEPLRWHPGFRRLLAGLDTMAAEAHR